MTTAETLKTDGGNTSPRDTMRALSACIAGYASHDEYRHASRRQKDAQRRAARHLTRPTPCAYSGA